MANTEKDKTMNELCSQLHKQYAEADNNKTKNLIYFIATIAFAFTGYGYVYRYMRHDHFAVISVCILVIIMLTAVYYVSINYGFSQRRDQIVINRIRRSYFDDSEYLTVFGNLYCPFEKKRWDFIPDYYKFLAFFSILLKTFVTIVSFLIIIKYSNTCCECSNSNCFITSNLLIFVIIIILIILFDILIYNSYYKKYRRISLNNLIFKCKDVVFLCDLNKIPKKGTFEISKDAITNKIQIKISES